MVVNLSTQGADDRKYFTYKGYGFIQAEDGNSYFFHISNTNLGGRYRYALDGLDCTFDPLSEADERGQRCAAVNVNVKADFELSEDDAADPDADIE